MIIGILSNLDNLDIKIIEFIIKEKTNSEIADITGFSYGYIKKRLSCLFKRFKVKSKVGLVREYLKVNFSLNDLKIS